jgi:Tol biopolymer transport system component
MAIEPGIRIGPYEIRDFIGSGGMGDVYRAVDTRLRRDVAIKTLRHAATASRERLDRFEQEALATAALNHPNIVVVYDVGTFDGTPYVVSELLDGSTLRQHVRGTGSSVRLAIDYGQQIARGLAAAHGRGITHRDLKPENIFVTRDGRVKILDFGLAKLMSPGIDLDPSGLLSTRVATVPGVVLGSLGYMAPEQVRGLEADHRCDIFSLGVVLYELVSGERPFAGATPADSMTAILHEDPPEPSGKHASPGLTRIIMRCLEKSPERRFQSASDLGFALEALSSPSGSGDLQPRIFAGLSAYGPLARRLAIVAGIVLLVVALVLVVKLGRGNDEIAPVVVRFPIGAPDGARLVGAEGRIPRFGLSPDGKSIAFVAETGEKSAVWLRSLDLVQATMVSGTEDAIGSPFWSPDGQSVAFFTRSSLKAVDLLRGGSRTICEMPFGFDPQGTWGEKTILVSTTGKMPFPSLYSVLASGGLCANTTFGPVRRGGFVETRQAQFLPDGRHLLFTTNGGDRNDSGTFVSSVDDTHSLTRVGPWTLASYAAGFLVFVEDGVLKAQRFDPGSLQLSGQPHAMTQSVEFADIQGARLAASPTGVVYAIGTIPQSEMVWLDRGGQPQGVALPADLWGDFDLSPDGAHLAVARRDRYQLAVIWSIDLTSGARRRISKEATGVPARPMWSPDGRRVAFTRNFPGRSSIAIAAFDGEAEREVFVDELPSVNLLGWSPDGASVLYTPNGVELMAIKTSGDPTPARLLEARGAVVMARASPSGSVLAYTTASADGNRTYLFAPGANQQPIAIADVGADYRWRGDGRELFYRDTGGFMAIDVGAGPSLTVGKPHGLFRVSREDALLMRGYGVSADGRRILIKRLVDGPAPVLTAVINWRLLTQ